MQYIWPTVSSHKIIAMIMIPIVHRTGGLVRATGASVKCGLKWVSGQRRALPLTAYWPVFFTSVWLNKLPTPVLF